MKKQGLTITSNKFIACEAQCVDLQNWVLV